MTPSPPSSLRTVRPATPDDAAWIAAIYNHYVAATVATFEEQPVAPAEMAERIAAVVAALPWVVIETDVGQAGYAYARPWHARSAYRYSVETTIYLAPNAVGKGVGAMLYAWLLDDLRQRGLHCAIGVIALPNPASVALHEKLGFRAAGVLRGVGFKFGGWVDVGYWALEL